MVDGGTCRHQDSRVMMVQLRVIPLTILMIPKSLGAYPGVLRARVVASNYPNTV